MKSALAARCLHYTQADSILVPARLNTGEFALPTTVLSDPAHVSKLGVLQELETRAIVAADIADHAAEFLIGNNLFTFDVDFSKDYAFATSDDLNQFDFAVHYQDRGFPATDVHNNRDRSEINGSQNKIDSGTAFWAAWAVKVTQEYPTSAGDIIVGQIHTPTSTRSPVISIDYGTNNQLEIHTRSDAELNSDGNGTKKVRYTGLRPAVGDTECWVLNACSGDTGTGFLQVWRNGSQIVDYSGPVGYFADGSKVWPKWGIYRATVPEPFGLSVFNPEWGTADLSDRVANPLPIPSL